jgi:G3E family GTPase
MDPVIWKEAPLETVLCVLDATTPLPKLDDALLRSQLRAADVVALSKTDLVDAAGSVRIRDAVRAVRPAAVLVDAPHGQVPAALLFPEEPEHAPRDPGPRRPTADRFETLSWTSDRLVSLRRLQAAIGRLAPKLARAKGLFEAVEQPGQQLVFQLAGGRATLALAGAPAPGLPKARVVFVAELGVLSAAEIGSIMEECVVSLAASRGSPRA